MTDREKELEKKLQELLLCVEEWRKLWDPNQPGISKQTANYYNAFHSFLTRGFTYLKKRVDETRYLSVS